MSHEENTGPWYLHFWPWFLVVLMVLSMAASLGTVVVAVGLGDLSVTSEGVAPIGVSTRVEPSPATRD